MGPDLPHKFQNLPLLTRTMATSDHADVRVRGGGGGDMNGDMASAWQHSVDTCSV